MEKDVMVTVGGLFSAGEGEEKDNVDLIVPGQYYWKNERHFLIYEEVLGDFEESTSNLIRFAPGEVSVRKSGLVTAEMKFIPEETTVTEYITPYGMILMQIHTKRIRIQEAEERITLWIDYTLSVDEEDSILDNYLRIIVQPRQREFSLR